MLLSSNYLNRIQDKFFPGLLRSRLSSAARKSSLRGPAFLLSFDCDTYKDARVVGEVHRKLMDIGITPIYAVPGEVLLQGAEAYGGIAESGAEFINHGHYKHSRLLDDGETYESWNFYDQISRDEMEEDVLRGHETLTKFLGKEPKGFRSPHFGSFQKEEELADLYRVLNTKNYEFSTSTVPVKALHNKALYQVSGLTEIPVGGGYDFPLTILDSYSFRYSKTFKYGPSDYIRQIKSLAEWFTSENKPYLLNLYADPSQVYDWPEFFEAMELLAPFNVPSYDALLQQVDMA